MSCNDVSSIKGEMKHRKCLKIVLDCEAALSLWRVLASLFGSLIS